MQITLSAFQSYHQRSCEGAQQQPLTDEQEFLSSDENGLCNDRRYINCGKQQAKHKVMEEIVKHLRSITCKLKVSCSV